MDEGSTPRPDPTVLTTEALHRAIDGLRTELLLALQGETDLTAERFRGVERQFESIERQRQEQKVDTANAIDAALTAQKDAVDKSELATTKAIDGTEKKLDAEVSGLRREIAGVQLRQSDEAGRQRGVMGRRTDQRDTAGLTIAAVSALVGVIAYVVGSSA